MALALVPDEAEVLDLPALAVEANRYHAEAESSARSAVEAAWHAGRALAKAHRQVGRTEFKRWVADNFDGSYETASLYKRIHENVEVYILGTDQAPQSVEQARKEIAAKRREGKPAPQPKPKPKPVAPSSDDYQGGFRDGFAAALRLAGNAPLSESRDLVKYQTVDDHQDGIMFERVAERFGYYVTSRLVGNQNGEVAFDRFLDTFQTFGQEGSTRSAAGMLSALTELVSMLDTKTERKETWQEQRNGRNGASSKRRGRAEKPQDVPF
jgi:hypothetical protein